jgi:hypothetical protein
VEDGEMKMIERGILITERLILMQKQIGQPEFHKLELIETELQLDKLAEMRTQD